MDESIVDIIEWNQWMEEWKQNKNIVNMWMKFDGKAEIFIFGEN